MVKSIYLISALLLLCSVLPSESSNYACDVPVDWDWVSGHRVGACIEQSFWKCFIDFIEDNYCPVPGFCPAYGEYKRLQAIAESDEQSAVKAQVSEGGPTCWDAYIEGSDPTKRDALLAKKKSLYTKKIYQSHADAQVSLVNDPYGHGELISFRNNTAELLRTGDVETRLFDMPYLSMDGRFCVPLNYLFAGGYSTRDVWVYVYDCNGLSRTSCRQIAYQEQYAFDHQGYICVSVKQACNATPYSSCIRFYDVVLDKTEYCPEVQSSIVIPQSDKSVGFNFNSDCKNVRN